MPADSPQAREIAERYAAALTDEVDTAELRRRLVSDPSARRTSPSGKP